MRTYKVGILGATGLVGQRLVERLENHPWFTLSALGASERSAGLRYAEAADWRLSVEPPEGAADLVVRRCEPSEFDDCDLVLSALDTDVARESEPRFAAAGLAVVSNSSAFRQQADVPLVVPEVNPDALAGYSRRNPIERMVRDGRMFTIGGGTAQILRTVVASHILGRKLPQTRDGHLKLAEREAADKARNAAE